MLVAGTPGSTCRPGWCTCRNREPGGLKHLKVKLSQLNILKISPGSDFASGLAPGLAAKGERRTRRRKTISAILQLASPSTGLGGRQCWRRWGGSRTRLPLNWGLLLRLSLHAESSGFITQNCGQWDKHVICETNARKYMNAPNLSIYLGTWVLFQLVCATCEINQFCFMINSSLTLKIFFEGYQMYVKRRILFISSMYHVNLLMLLAAHLICMLVHCCSTQHSSKILLKAES